MIKKTVKYLQKYLGVGPATLLALFIVMYFDGMLTINFDSAIILMIYCAMAIMIAQFSKMFWSAVKL